MAKPSYIVKEVEWRLYEKALKEIRKAVFVVEQNVPLEIEWDGKDATAIHVLAIDVLDAHLGTARLLPTGQIGRMAVLRKYRKLGIGSALLVHLLNISREHKIQDVFLNAQVDAIDFYKRFGFIETGDIFMEAGIKHKKMVLNE